VGQRREIKKIAKSKPAEHGLPFSTWSLHKLAEFLVAEGVVDDISHEGLRVLLGEEGVTFQRLKTWKASTDPGDGPRRPCHRRARATVPNAEAADCRGREPAVRESPRHHAVAVGSRRRERPAGLAGMERRWRSGLPLRKRPCPGVVRVAETANREAGHPGPAVNAVAVVNGCRWHVGLACT